MTRFTTLVGDDGETVTAIHDTLLNLEWHPTSLRGKNWQHCMDQVVALGDDWRAPTVDELASLCDRTRREPACDPVLNMPFDDWHWSSSPVVGWPEGAWYVCFDLGYVGSYLRYTSGFVRPVRVARARQ